MTISYPVLYQITTNPISWLRSIPRKARALIKLISRLIVQAWFFILAWPNNSSFDYSHAYAYLGLYVWWLSILYPGLSLDLVPCLSGCGLHFLHINQSRGPALLYTGRDAGDVEQKYFLMSVMWVKWFVLYAATDSIYQLIWKKCASGRGNDARVSHNTFQIHALSEDILFRSPED